MRRLPVAAQAAPQLPPDSDTGKKLRLRGRGLPGKPDAGDQIVEIEVTAPRADNDEQREAYAKLGEAFKKNA